MPLTQEKRVLIVDDEPHLTMLLAASLEKLGKYTIETANNGYEALTKVQETKYNLLLTDYMMPGMSGLALAQEVRRISPDTQVVLMTAHGTDRLRDQVGELDFDGYIDKPFTTNQIRDIVEDAIGRTTTKADPYRSGERQVDQPTRHQLETLRKNTSAWCVLLLSSGGYPIDVVGHTTNLDVANMSALIAANFVAAAQLANMLGNSNSIFRSSYHEGDDYNIYAYKVNDDLLLAVVFGAESKPGVVWFYTKQSAATLAQLAINPPADDKEGITFGKDDLSAALDAEFAGLFGGGGNDEGSLFAPAVETQPEVKPTPPPKPPARPMSYQEAVAAGLVPEHIAHREKGK
jgi:CheY-like chemotaxis protein/predicted regulator of Ras-like GTPase activity (Roadblock/LC7/MglB family)